MLLKIYAQFWPYCWDLNVLRFIHNSQAYVHLLFGNHHPPADSVGGLRLLQSGKYIWNQTFFQWIQKLVITVPANAIIPTGARPLADTVRTSQLEIIFSKMLCIVLLRNSNIIFIITWRIFKWPMRSQDNLINLKCLNFDKSCLFIVIFCAVSSFWHVPIV